MNKIKTIFIGSGEFAVPILKKLLEIDFIDLKAVITQPDKPVGRKQELEPTEVGKYAQLRITNDELREFPSEVEGSPDAVQSALWDILKPTKIRQVADELLAKYEPELIIVASYGQIIPNNLLDFPKYKCLNIHGSLLPKLRGAVPVQMAILQGFERTGVTLQIMAEKMDVGDIITNYELQITSVDTSESLMGKLANLAAENIEMDLKRWIEGEIEPIKQDDNEATYCYKDDISKEKAEITFETDINLAERMIKAFYPWPIAWVKYNGKVLKIYNATHAQLQITNDELRIFKEGKKLYLGLKNGCLELLEVQLEGKQRRLSVDYLFLANSN
jgi:methionyl-tRNA formyltransferase